MSINLDKSWGDMGGIGRFYREISQRLNNVTSTFILKNPASFYSAILYARINFFFCKNKVMVSPGYIPPIFHINPFVFTVHDLNHIDRVENSSILKRFFYKYVIARGCRQAAAVLTVSCYSKQKIVDWAKISPSKVINVGNGVDESFSSDVIPFIASFRYFLCVSNRKLHKNEHRLIHAFSESTINSDIKLVFTGEPNSDLLALIKDLGIEDKVVFKGRVADEDLPALYRGAMGLLFPSLYEGFGLPVVEAMACGVPVLTSNTTSLPEVAGDAALLVNPESVDEIRIGIERLVYDDSLRAELITKGLERAKLFSWDAVAARVQAVLDEVVERHGK